MISRVGRFGFVAGLALVLLLATLAVSAEEVEGQAASLPVLQARTLQGLRADVAALILGGREGGALWAAMLAIPVPEEDGKFGVDVWIELDGARLLGDGDRSPARLKVEVHAYAMRTSGGLAGSVSQSFRIPVAELGEAFAHGGVKLRGRLDLLPGAYELRVLVREIETQRYVLRILPLRLPATGDEGINMWSPLFPDVPDTWIEVRPVPPESASPVPSVPSALPVLAAGRSHTARIPIHGNTDGKLRLAARLLDAKRKPIGKVEVDWKEKGSAEQGEASANGLRYPEVRLELPDDLLTGNYFLETSLAGRGKGGSELRTTQVYVLGLERTETDVVWTDLGHLASLSARRREALDLAAERRASKRVSAIAGAYREVLEILASGQVEEAGSELDRLETEVLETDPAEGRGWLVDGQDRVLTTLARAGAESLVPVLLLHMQRHEGYISESRRALTYHARERVIATARRYVEAADSEFAPALAAEALSDMGLSLARVNMRVAGRRMMEEALALDPNNPESILGMAVDHEQRDEPQLAVAYLRRLLELDPNSEEGRLRLVLNLRRAGERAEARRHLRRVLADGTSEWLLSLAYQEQAEMFLAQQRLERMIERLEAAIKRLPSQKRLYILLAYALDRSGEGRRAREVLRRIPADSDEMSARLRYSRHFRGVTESSRPDLLRQSLARLAILSQALNEPDKKPGKKQGKASKKPNRKPRGNP